MHTTPLARRTLLKGAALAVVGYSVSQAAWTTGAAQAADLSRTPRLDGTLELSPAVRSQFSTDFGHFVTAQPAAVLRPGSVKDIQAMMRFAFDKRIKVAVNGQSGEGADTESHSNYGQALAPGGLQIDAQSMSTIHRISADSAWVDMGVTWARLVDAALPHGLTVPALTDYLHLSIGGTVSVGGVGASVQRYGLQSDIISEIEIVNGRGEVSLASRTRNAQLFHAALAGAGQAGVITKLRVALVPAKGTATITNLFYSNVQDYAADQKALMAAGRYDHHSGEVLRNADDSGWLYKIELGSYLTPPEQGPAPETLDGLRDDRALRTSFTLPYRDWAFRIDEFAVYLREAGHWAQKKPWLSLLIPGDKVVEFVNATMPELTKADLGEGFCLLSPLDPAKIKSPMFVLPHSSDGTVFFFDLLNFYSPETTGFEAMLQRNRRLYDRLVAMGGKRYIIGAVPNMTVTDWKRHFGKQYDVLQRNKAAFDPRYLLAPGQNFFG
ncbi:FAD-binding protein [Pseudarthrobacter oxydans]|uniref:FAD-binding protein n=1 Tax=Pseudarthrobacter oxydans TaxID=1671 RepID=UPI002937CD8A|nr:FAD-binding protein [Actinomycetes bacterium ARC8]